jgi:putative ABC transport system permease protein
MTGSLPNKGSSSPRGYFLDESARATQTIALGSWSINSHYIPLLGMSMVAGRNFSSTMQTDSSAILINETAAHLLGYPDPVGKYLYTGPSPVVAYRILGVVKDFNAGTLHDKIEPIVFHLRDDRRAVSFKISTADIPGLIAKIRDRYRSLGKAAGHPFVYSFMDDDFNKLYESDRRTGNLFMSFALFAIFIACLGLFGLVTYAAEQRTKEIGIRKVLGATVTHIVGLLSMDFLKLVTLAASIASPIAWWGMHKWLQDFAYRTAIGWWVFPLAGILAALITILTVSFRALKAAMANPIESLRTD